MPCTKLALRAKTDRRYIRSTYRSNRFILAEVTAPHQHAETNSQRTRPSVNLCFVLDRSGSMSGEKIALAKQAVEQSIGRLQASDRFSVVVYDDQIDVVIPSTLATHDAKRDAITAVARIDARNQTNLGEGWLRGCEQVALHLQAEGVNRTLLLTDGLANVGITDRDDLASHAAELRSRGVQTSTFGVGTDFDEVLLQQLATAGGGNFYYIADGRAIPDYITSEVGEALDVVARNVTLDVVAPEGVVVESLMPFPIDQRGGRSAISLGSMVAEQVVQLVLRLSFPLGEMGRETGAVISVSAGGESVDDASQSLTWEYAGGKANDLQERDAEVDRAVASVFAARARQEASQLNRAGNYPAAQDALASVAKRIRSYAGRDSLMRMLISELDRESEQLAAPMAPAAVKEMYFRGYASAKTRNFDGTALRRKQS
ncbi:MAG TPA: VWA domain-containing protein [Candidatus Limnocylindrales bacterium]